jgi:predicted amidophosphoribosyltransferase
LLITGIKSGEMGWRRALLLRVAYSELPRWAACADLVTSAPSSAFHRFLRGFDFAEEAARAISKQLGLPYTRTLGKYWFASRQAKQTESNRRRMPQRNLFMLKKATVAGKTILLVDDVWTTGTTLLRCAKTLGKAGAKDVMVLSLFRVT